MSDLFLLGAGFSKAISDTMPITKELAGIVLDRYKYKDRIDPIIRAMMEEDEGQGFEKALTFLTQDKPWLPESENLRHKALYLDMANVIRGVLQEIMRGPMVWRTNQPPLWLEALITYWHDNRSSVITLNYDTLIERVASSVYWPKRSKEIPTANLYPIILTPAGQRNESICEERDKSNEVLKTFKLFKLHGSTNWFYSGRSDFFGEQLFYVPCKVGVDGPFDALEGRDPEKSHWSQLADKVPLIMPPALDKSAFFQHESLRSMWFQASRAIEQARRIICIGYSLPASDLTMAQFLKSSAPPNRIPFEIINITAGLDTHFARLVGSGYEFRQNEANINSVARFVVKACIPNQEDKVHVSRMTLWKEQS